MLNKFRHYIVTATAVLITFCSLQAFAQDTGSVNGKVIDALTGDPLIGVTVLVEGTQVYSVTDISGTYNLINVPAGPQKVLFQMMGYEKSAADINLAPGQTERINISMSYKQAKEVVVKAKRISNTQAALLLKEERKPL
jgi:hypothetical protein